MCQSVPSNLFYVIHTVLTHGLTEGENQALVGAIPFRGEHPGPRFEDKFRSANQMDEISKAGGDNMAAS